MSEIFKSTKEQKKEARKRIKNREVKHGSDEDYYKSLIETYHYFSDTRERVEKTELIASEL